MAPGAPDRDGHIAPKVALVEVTRRQRADLEETADPAREFDDARHVIRTRMVLEISSAPLSLAVDRRRLHAPAEPQHGIDEMGAHPQHRRTGSSVEGPDLPDAALLHDLLDPPPMAGVLELMADDGLHAARAERDNAPGVGQRERERLLERDRANAMPHPELDELDPHRRRGGETEQVGALGGEHGLGVGVDARDAKRVRERAEARGVAIAERHQLEPVPIREKAKRMALSARPAADEHGPMPTLHPGILQRRRAPDDGLGDEADTETGTLCRLDETKNRATASGTGGESRGLLTSGRGGRCSRVGRSRSAA